MCVPVPTNLIIYAEFFTELFLISELLVRATLGAGTERRRTEFVVLFVVCLDVELVAALGALHQLLGRQHSGFRGLDDCA